MCLFMGEKNEDWASVYVLAAVNSRYRTFIFEWLYHAKCDY